MRRLVALVAVAGSVGCATVEPGEDFSIAEVVYDEGYFYCRVEPVLFARRCGAGDPSAGDPAGGCHYAVTAYRLTEYGPPLVADGCGGGVVPRTPITPEAQKNYQASQVEMQRDPELADLLRRPVGSALHPRQLFSADSPEADLIREWATRFSTQ
ncbi:MAG: hypothetical protein IT376_00990 [Polyangiaceae bacterium]|nr:hypothetical protein [Polyangiaceae bacterium]